LAIASFAAALTITVLEDRESDRAEEMQRLESEGLRKTLSSQSEKLDESFKLLSELVNSEGDADSSERLTKLEALTRDEYFAGLAEREPDVSEALARIKKSIQQLRKDNGQPATRQERSVSDRTDKPKHRGVISDSRAFDQGEGPVYSLDSYGPGGVKADDPGRLGHLATTQPPSLQQPRSASGPPSPSKPESASRVVQGGDKVHLRSFHDTYLVAINDSGVMAHRSRPRERETWTLIDINGGALRSGDKIHLQSYHGKYLVAINDGGSRANRPRASEWETWNLLHE